jgi:uncharacterized protein YndB with AHSA1/START domain
MGNETSVVIAPDEPTLVMTRVFDAPRRLVWDATTKCEHLKRWWGPRGFELVFCEMDPRPGGTYRYVQRAPDGSEHPFKGEYREVVPPERVVNTFIYDVEGIRDHVAVVTGTLDEEDGKTTLTSTTVFESIEVRDAALATGMVEGAKETYERLDELLATLS